MVPDGNRIPPRNSQSAEPDLPARRTAAGLDLSSFSRPVIAGDRPLAVKTLWYLISALLFQHALAIYPSAAKAAMLRLFGAAIGRGVIIKPRVTIKSPWLLSIGHHSWLGEQVWIDNPGRISIGANVCISQGAYLVTGNHDFTDSGFGFFAAPIEVGDRSWIGAQAILPPGSVIPEGTVVPIGSVWRNRDLDQRGSGAPV